MPATTKSDELLIAEKWANKIITYASIGTTVGENNYKIVLSAITEATNQQQKRIEKCEKLLDTYLHYCCDVGGQEPDTGEIISPTDDQWTELFGATKALLHPDPTPPTQPTESGEEASHAE